MQQLTRREFLKGTAAVLAAPILVRASSVGAGERPAPSNRIALGAIGLGGMGSGDLGDFLGRSEVQVVATCDADIGRAEGAKKRVEQHYAGKAERGDFKGCTATQDFREVLANPAIDAVMIATPDHWHAIPVIMAARAGKDIHCQKPLSLTIAQGRAMVEAVTRYGRVFQTGSQQRSDRNFRYACELVRNGRVGKLQTMEVGLPGGSQCPPQPEKPVPAGFDYNLWLGPAPWAPYCDKRTHWDFRWILDYSGGQVTDWGAHHCDIAQWGNGTSHTGPDQVEGVGEFPRDGLWTAAMNYRFVLTYPSGVQMICSNRYPNGVRFVGTEGWVFVDRGHIRSEPKSLITSVIGPGEVHLYESADHKGNFLECIRTRGATIAPIENAHRSVSCAHLGNLAMLLGRKLKWDPEKERFINDPEADRMLSRAMRAPWVL